MRTALLLLSIALGGCSPAPRTDGVTAAEADALNAAAAKIDRPAEALPAPDRSPEPAPQPAR